MQIGKGLSVGLVLLALIIAFGGDTTMGQTQQCTVTVQPGDSIQEAIELYGRDSDPVICLAEGTWEENIQISNNLTIRGAGRNGQGSWLSSIEGTEPGVPVLRLESRTNMRATLEGFSTLNGKPFRSNTLCRRKSPQWICPDGIQVWNSAEVSIHDVRIANNRFVGLLLLNSAEATVSDTIITGNRYGVDMSGSSHMDASTTRIAGNEFYGIELLDNSTAIISSSSVEDNGVRCFNSICNGITVFDRVDLRIEDSEIVENKDWGLAAALFKCGYNSNSFYGHVRLVDNEISGNGRGQVCLP